MVTLLKDYEQQTYFLNTADIGDIVFRNGDQVFLMDQDRLQIYDKDANNWYPVNVQGSGGDTYHFYTYTPASDTSINDVLNAANIPLLAQDEILIWNIKGANKQSSGSVGFKFGVVVVQDGNVVSKSCGTKRMASVEAPDSSQPSSIWDNDGRLKIENGHYVCSQTTLVGYVGGGNTFEFVQLAYNIGWNVET